MNKYGSSGSDSDAEVVYGSKGITQKVADTFLFEEFQATFWESLPKQR